MDRDTFQHRLRRIMVPFHLTKVHALREKRKNKQKRKKQEEMISNHLQVQSSHGQ